MPKRRASSPEELTTKRVHKESAPKCTQDDEQEREQGQDLSLPPELLHAVCSHLGTHGVTSFRLVCKDFAAIGEEHLVEELCFFPHVRSVAKVAEIAKDPKWAKQVKTLVFENVEPKDWSTMRKESDLANHRFDGKIHSRYQSFCWTLSCQQDSFTCDWTLPIIFAITEFTKLEAIFCHHGFKEPRSLTPHANTPLKDMFDRYKPRELQWQFWKDRGSGRIFAPAKYPTRHAWRGGANRTVYSWWTTMQSALNSPYLQKLNTVDIESHQSAVLAYWSERAKDYLPDGNKLKHLSLKYHPHSLTGRPNPTNDPGSFLRDLKYIPQSQTAPSTLTSVTLGSELDDPAKFLDLSPLGDDFVPNWPNLKSIQFVNCAFVNDATVGWLSQQRIWVTVKNARFAISTIDMFKHGNCLDGLNISGLLLIIMPDHKVNSYVWMLGDKHDIPLITPRFTHLVAKYRKSRSEFEYVCPNAVSKCLLEGRDLSTVPTRETL